ncbi:DNA-binding protein [Sinorhizobium meliloti]|uniref:DNA-binding protein n=1 Tax=Rhizobium meliloti TaxID=382 RepID=UPI000416876B|nr:DNA-binding protein [Sinorhizobium meliloti]MDE4620645.1 DNA-binding protein [Sinorhizobium meliloti]
MNTSLPALAYDIPSAVSASGIGRTKLFEAMKLGKLKARKLGRKTIILPEDLKAFIESLPVKEAA